MRDIQLRTTTLHTYNDEVVAIPNSDVFTHPVINYTRLGRRRHVITFDTSVKADSQKIQSEVLRIVEENSEVKKEPKPFVLMSEIESGSDVVTWKLYYWADPSKVAEITTKSELLIQLKTALYDAGVPTPTATILRR